MVNTDQSFKKLSLTSNYKIHSYIGLESVRKNKTLASKIEAHCMGAFLKELLLHLSIHIERKPLRGHGKKLSGEVRRQ